MMNNSSVVLPDYQGGSIVNLMSTILQVLGTQSNQHPSLVNLDIEQLSRATNVVLLVLDGLGYRYLCEQGSRSLLYRNLHSQMTSVFPSTTATAISTFMTGLAPQQHGLTGWFTYFEEISRVLAVLPCKTRYYSNSAGNNSEEDEIVIDSQSLYGHTPLFDLLTVDSYVVTPQQIAYSEFSLSHRGRAVIKPYTSLSECFDFTADIINSHSQRKYIYTYWPEFDGMAHEVGVGSQEVAEHFAEIDKAFGKLIKDIKGTNTLVLCTADHGIIDSGPEYCIELQNYPDLQAMLSLPLSGERRLAYCYVDPGRQDEFKQIVQDKFGEQIDLHESRELLSKNIYGLGQPHPKLATRIGDFMLSMKSNMTIMDTLASEKRFYHMGTHGGLSAQEMLVPLIVVEV